MTKNPVIEAGILANPGVLLLTFYPEPEAIGEGLLAIGDDEGTTLAMQHDKAIVAVEKAGTTVIRFVNSNPERLARCIRTYEQYCACIGDCSSETEELVCVDWLEDGLREADAEALSDPDCFWATVVEQARHGML